MFFNFSESFFRIILFFFLSIIFVLFGFVVNIINLIVLLIGIVGIEFFLGLFDVFFKIF